MCSLLQHILAKNLVKGLAQPKDQIYSFGLLHKGYVVVGFLHKTS
jgi:hypothetical protein